MTLFVFFFAILAVPFMIFLLFVAPMWLVLYYRNKNKLTNGLSDDDFERLEMLSKMAESMQYRIVKLESILDRESPNWRRYDN